MRKLCRAAILAAVALLYLQPAILLVPVARAGAMAPAASSRVKKKNKRSKIKNRKLILKGHHGKHGGRPA